MKPSIKTSITLYGHPVSQPSRAVFWLCQLHRLPYTYVKLDPMAGDTQRPEFLAKNPMGTIPFLEDSNHDVRLSERYGACMAGGHEQPPHRQWHPHHFIDTRVQLCDHDVFM